MPTYGGRHAGVRRAVPHCHVWFSARWSVFIRRAWRTMRAFWGATLHCCVPYTAVHQVTPDWWLFACRLALRGRRCARCLFAIDVPFATEQRLLEDSRLSHLGNTSLHVGIRVFAVGSLVAAAHLFCCSTCTAYSTVAPPCRVRTRPVRGRSRTHVRSVHAVKRLLGAAKGPSLSRRAVRFFLDEVLTLGLRRLQWRPDELVLGMALGDRAASAGWHA